MYGLTARAGSSGWRAAAIIILSLFALGVASAARAETRVLKFYNLHTHEKGSFTYKAGGRYDSDQLKKINWILRDWRKNQSVTMDPRLLDLIWEAYQQSGSNGYIQVICGYRSPSTNSMLRSRSSGVAKKSQHTLGRALDFYIPGVPLKRMREIGLKMQVGGVGYYPRSGSPFVHFDIGNARHWPRMSRKELLAVFPNGHTVHVPSDGRPLPGYQQALADYKSRRSQSEIQVANAGSSSSGGGKSLIAMLFGGGNDTADEADDAAEAADDSAPSAPARAVPAPVAVADAAIPQSRPTRQETTPVAVPLRDEFDTGAPAAAGRETEVAALEIARVPVPTFAPSRETTASVAVATASEPADSDSAASDELGRLVAALEDQRSEVASGSQLAYAVPTPTDRPPFDSVLKDAARQSQTSGTKILVADAIPQPRPAVKSPVEREIAGPKRELAASAVSRAAVASVMSPASFERTKPAPRAAAAKGAAERKVVVATKGGRVLTVGPQAPAQPVVIDAQEAIASRIEVAVLITDPGDRAESITTPERSASALVGRMPRELLARGFAADHDTGKTGRFSGSAVSFAPVVKLRP
ncbi:DUF882 domain-containing protein [Aurantimonas sp. VKM B-3413]|uniref:DUF882 domain-containing protein n=1 Tax=Aurantimonas sp. VKM B-3413 TaxID=2779401 RepID=UPI001E45AF88|nr:DUF882 domain-containing protein [Aurantimonas sp. VKM B-3413]MCB8839561.1 DUF882 domain-containing protein [Aurantimonas sp. VKM B-3413]